MPAHDIIVVGASAGGVEALRALVGKLPKDLPAAVLVVLHLSPDHPSYLPRILTGAGPLPASHPQEGEKPRHGHIYVAPPDRHLVVDDGVMRLTRSPKEGGHRPAIDTLFRTAAEFHGTRVVAVILSGALDDGTAGLMAVKQRGGVTVVQDPDEALVGDMPRSALDNVDIDHCLKTVDIAKLIGRLAHEPVEVHSPIPELLQQERDIALERRKEGEQPPGHPSELACPACGGVLNELHDGGLLRFRCRVGHAFGPDSLDAEQQHALDGALWAGKRALEEKATLNRRLAQRSRDRRYEQAAKRFEARASTADEQARLVHEVLIRAAPPHSADQQIAPEDANPPEP